MLIWPRKAEHHKLKKWKKKIESIYNNAKKQIQNLVILITKNKKFHQYKRPISMKNIDINKIVLTNKVSFRKKGFK